MKIKENIEFSFTLCTFFGFLWFYLLNSIKDITYSHPTDDSLLHLGFIHFVIFCYFIFSLILLYTSGVKLIGKDVQPELPNKLVMFVFFSWPLAIFVALVAFLAANIGIGGWQGVLLSFSIPAILLVAVIFSNRRFKSFGIEAFKTYGSYAIGIAIILLIGCFPYWIVMSIIFSEVSLETDKKFYNANEKVEWLHYPVPR